MITKDQYGEWRNHPATLFFRQFIKDRREAMIAAATESWLNDPKFFESESHVGRGRILELFEVEDVAYESIEKFYEEKNATEDPIDQTS